MRTTLGDEMLSTEEFEALFTRIDTDEDGLLTAWELKELLGSLGQEVGDEAAATMLGFIDADGDGRVTREELKAYLDKA